MALTKATFGVVSSALASGNATDGYVLTADGSGGTAWEASAGGVDGIVSNADATAITIDSSENVGIGTTTPSSYYSGADNLVVSQASGEGGITIVTANNTYGNLYFADGTSGADAYRGGIIYGHSANNMNFYTDGSERMRIDSSGKVGIGSSPSYTLDVAKDFGQTTAGVRVWNKNSNWGAKASINFLTDTSDSSNYPEGNISLFRGTSSDADSGMEFSAGTSSQTVRMKYHATKTEVLINRSASFGAASSASLIVGSASDQTIRVLGTNTSGYTFMGFFNGGLGQIGSITNNGNTATSYNTSSDHRLKENVVAMTGSIDRVKQLQPKRFNWIVDESNTLVDGFLAHEAQTVVAEAVTGVHNETKELSNVVLNSSNSVLATDITEEKWTAGKVDTLWTEEDELPDGVSVGDVRMEAIYPSDSTWNATYSEPIYQGIDQAKLVPLLTGALQEAITKIEQLEARITTLENA